MQDRRGLSLRLRDRRPRSDPANRPRGKDHPHRGSHGAYLANKAATSSSDPPLRRLTVSGLSKIGGNLANVFRVPVGAKRRTCRKSICNGGAEHRPFSLDRRFAMTQPSNTMRARSAEQSPDHATGSGVAWHANAEAHPPSALVRILSSGTFGARPADVGPMTTIR